MSRVFWATVCIVASGFVVWCTLLVLDVVHLDGKGEKRQPGLRERYEKMTEEERDREQWERTKRLEERWEKWDKQDERR